MPKETIHVHSMYWVRKYALHYIIQKLKQRRYQQTYPASRGFVCLVCLFVFSYEVLCLACQWLVMLWHNNPKGKGGSPYNGLYGQFLIDCARKSSIICYQQCSYISKIMPIITLIFCKLCSFYQTFPSYASTFNVFSFVTLGRTRQEGERTPPPPPSPIRLF